MGFLCSHTVFMAFNIVQCQKNIVFVFGFLMPYAGFLFNNPQNAILHPIIVSFARLRHDHRGL